MADNFEATEGAGTKVAADEVSYGGDTVKLQVVHQVHVAGSEGSKTVTEIAGAVGTPSASALTVQGSPTGAAQPVSRAVVSATHLVSAASTNATSVKGSAGTLRGLHLFNNRATPVFVKFHNTAGTPTAGTGTVRTFGIQAGMRLDVELGIAFATGIGMTTVLEAADNGTTGIAAGDLTGEVLFD